MVAISSEYVKELEEYRKNASQLIVAQREQIALLKGIIAAYEGGDAKEIEEKIAKEVPEFANS